VRGVAWRGIRRFCSPRPTLRRSRADAAKKLGHCWVTCAPSSSGHRKLPSEATLLLVGSRHREGCRRLEACLRPGEVTNAKKKTSWAAVAPTVTLLIWYHQRYRFEYELSAAGRNVISHSCIICMLQSMQRGLYRTHVGDLQGQTEAAGCSNATGI
jgi:hypothetical protein